MKEYMMFIISVMILLFIFFVGVVLHNDKNGKLLDVDYDEILPFDKNEKYK
jgi:hypothetical protein